MVHRIIQFDHEAWLKPYIFMNTGLRKDEKNDFEKDFFKLMNNSAFGKTMENGRNHRDFKLVSTDKQRSIVAYDQLSFQQTHSEIFNNNGNEKGRNKNE